MVSLIGVRKSYVMGRARVSALRDLSLEVGAGEFVCVMGPSGSGKSTLLNIIGCLDKPDAGLVRVGGKDLSELGRNGLAELRSELIGIIFQSFNLIPVLDVYENIEFPLYVRKSVMRRAKRRERVMSLIRGVGLEDFVTHKPDELSGGQRQRVAIARALVGRPRIVLADEPTANLDSATGRAIVELMRDLNRLEGTTFIFSTHDPSITEFASKTFRLRDGALAVRDEEAP